MGKGGGSCLSKQGPAAAVQAAEPASKTTSAEPIAPAAPAVDKPVGKMAKIYIVFYSTYGHIYQMAKAIKEGVDSVEGCEGILYQVCSACLGAHCFAKCTAETSAAVGTYLQTAWLR